MFDGRGDSDECQNHQKKLSKNIPVSMFVGLVALTEELSPLKNPTPKHTTWYVLGFGKVGTLIFLLNIPVL